MCGICGIFKMKNGHKINEEIIEKMTAKLLHRGPDATDYYVNESVALGFTRLSFLDIEGGMQPIFNEDRSIVLVCNGEIYNYVDIRKNLMLNGHVFKTQTDIEVILHLYEEYGAGFLNELNGQFAFVIYDSRKKLMFCARDHMGISPFFYTIVDNSFIFASEIKAILEHTSVKREVDLVALDQILTLPGLVSPRTMFKNIKSLENGHFLLIFQDGRIQDNEYWDLIYPEINEINYVEDENYYIEKLDELLTKAVKTRLHADVPVGFYISGGLDSSIIAAKVSEIDRESLRHSFSIDFDDKNISEVKYQRLMSSHIGSIHHEKHFDISDIYNRIKKVIFYSESPLKETYNTASMALSESVKDEKIKAVLTGEGADELFAGYVGYRFDKLRQQQSKQLSSEELLEQGIRQEIWGDENLLYEKNYSSHKKLKKDLYSENINSIYKEIDCFRHPIIRKERINNRDSVHKRSYIDYKLRLSEHLLADHGDRMAYANSIEVRYPFLDRELVEFIRLIPPNLKLKGFDEKYILKKLADKLVPNEIIKRPKFTFVAPGSPELIKENNELINSLLSNDRIVKSGYFNPKKVETLKNEYARNGFKLNLPYESDLLIIVMTFSLFLEEFKLPSI